MNDHPLPRGIVPVVQTPFLQDGAVDEESLARLVERSISAGARGFLAPAVASEVDSLDNEERQRVTQVVAEAAASRVPLIVGASSESVQDSVELARSGAALGAAAFLVSVPATLRDDTGALVSHFQSVARQVSLPMIVQDLDWNGPGLSLDSISQLADRIPNFAGLKIETVPAGPKYSLVRERLGTGCFLAGGWAVPQMIEALDRGVDALMPESSMVPVYARVDSLYRGGDRERAQRLFREILPVLAYTNQEIRTSIAFFKELLVHKGIFRTAVMRKPFEWDPFNRRIAAELLDLYLDVERRVSLERPFAQ